MRGTSDAALSASQAGAAAAARARRRRMRVPAGRSGRRHLSPARRAHRRRRAACRSAGAGRIEAGHWQASRSASSASCMARSSASSNSSSRACCRQGARRTTSAFALTPASVVPLPLSLFAELIEADGVLRSRVIRIGSQRLLAALMQQHDKVHTFPDLLLADWLVELSADIGIAEGNRVRFPRKIAQKHIAADLGVSRETISRRLNEWERSGLLRTGARSQQIEILDYQRISRLASLRSARKPRRARADHRRHRRGDRLRRRDPRPQYRSRHLRYYPSSPELHHRTALAAARAAMREGRSSSRALGPPHERIVERARGRREQGAQEPISTHGPYPLRTLRRRRLWRGRVGARPPQRRARGGARGTTRRGLAALNARLLKEQAFETVRAADRKKQAKRLVQCLSRPLSSIAKATIRASTRRPWR